MVRPEVLRRKLARLHDLLFELERHRGVPFEGYVAPGGPRREVERLIQLVVECATDINVHMVTELGGAPPPDYRSSFLRLAELGVIPYELGQRLASSAGMRNVLVHEYERIDDRRIHAAIPLVLDGFADFASAVRAWLDSLPAETEAE